MNLPTDHAREHELNQSCSRVRSCAMVVHVVILYNKCLQYPGRQLNYEGSIQEPRRMVAFSHHHVNTHQTMKAVNLEMSC